MIENCLIVSLTDCCVRNQLSMYGIANCDMLMPRNEYVGLSMSGTGRLIMVCSRVACTSVASIHQVDGL